MQSAIAKVLIAMLTSNALQNVFLTLAEHYAAKTDNKIDDELVAALKKALAPQA